MYLGKAIRLGRLFDDESGRLLAITLDHAIARGVLPGLVDVESAVASVAAGRPDAITLQKGIAARVFSPAYATAGISLIVKATSYSPFHPTLDTPTAPSRRQCALGPTRSRSACWWAGQTKLNNSPTSPPWRGKPKPWGSRWRPTYTPPGGANARVGPRCSRSEG